MTGQAVPPAHGVVPNPSDVTAALPARDVLDRVMLIRERPRLWTALVVLSGLSVLPLIYVAGLVYGVLLSGWVFGALVLLPFLDAPRARLWRALGLVAIPALIHWGAMLLTAFLDKHVEGPPAYAAAAVICGVPGLAAALLCGLLTALLAPLRPVGKILAIASAAGLAGGLGFVFARTLGGYVIWQLLVFLALRLCAKAPPPEAGRLQ